jgi:hypothetical protein
VVQRTDDALLVVPAVDADVAERTAEMLRFCGTTEGNPGARRIRHLAWMITDAEPGEVPSFAFVVASGETSRVMVHGEVTVGVEGQLPLSFSGTESVAWVERVIPAGFDTLTIQGSPESLAPHPLDAVLDLVVGTVPGCGVTARRAPSAQRPSSLAPERPAEAPARLMARPSQTSPAAPQTSSARPTPASAPPTPVSAGTARAGTPSPAPAAPEGATVIRATAHVRHVPLSQRAADPGRPARPPLPIGPGSSTAETSPQADRVQVQGVMCRCGQFNDPDAGRCSACNTPIDRGGRLETRPRPPLGILITDDGRVCTVTGDLVIGREPEQAPDVRAKRARPLVLQDAEHSTSRVHAHLRVSGWKVLVSDGGSANGTFISRAGPAGPWTAVLREPGTPLGPGDRVRLGKRQLLFDRYHEAL